MTEQLFSVGMRNRTTLEEIKLWVWAFDVDEATTKVVNAIGGYDGEYSWTGSGPIYRNNEVVKRQVRRRING